MRAASIYSRRRRGIKIIRNPTAGRPIYIFGTPRTTSAIYARRNHGRNVALWYGPSDNEVHGAAERNTQVSHDNISSVHSHILCWLAPADSRCEDMPNTTPLPPPTLARAHGTAHGRPTVGNASAPTDAYPSSHPATHAAGHARCSRAPHATQRAHTVGPSRSLPSIGLPVLLFRCTTTQLQTLSPSAPRRERQVVRQHHGASGRSSGCRMLSLATVTSM